MKRHLNQIRRLSNGKPTTSRRFSRSLRVETLEKRCLLAGDASVAVVDGSSGESTQEYLLVNDFDKGSVWRYDGHTGAFVDEFVPRRSGGLNQPVAMVLGPHDDNLYVGASHFSGPGQFIGVLRFDGTTGDFIDEFADSGLPSENCQYAAADPSERCGLLTSVHSILFGPDGNLYVQDWSGGEPKDDFLGVGKIVRFDGTTGEFMDEFVATNSGGLKHPIGMVFGPADNSGDKLDLYVVDLGDNSVLRYDGETGEFIDTFVPSGSGGLDGVFNLVFGPDGNLYVSDFSGVLRYQGPSGETPGAFIDRFVPAESGGLGTPFGILFGPDGNGDNHQDLYVANINPTGIGGDRGNNGNVKRYDGVTGAFIDTFVTSGSGGIDSAWNLTFTHTDPVTLAYVEPESTASAAGSTVLAVRPQIVDARAAERLSVAPATLEPSAMPLPNDCEQHVCWRVVVVTPDQGPKVGVVRSTLSPVDEGMLDDLFTDSDQLLTDELLDLLTSEL